MRTLLFDIETIPLGNTTDLELALSPAAAEMAVLTVFDVEKNVGTVYFTKDTDTNFDIDNWQVKILPEAEILKEFWEGVAHYDVFVGFGFRRFDIPFITHRSIASVVRPGDQFRKHRMLNKQSFPLVIDLFDEYSFYGDMQKPLSLKMLAELNKLKQPESVLEYTDLHSKLQQGSNKDVLEHCKTKILITTELFDIWKENLATEKLLNALLQ